MTQKAFDAAQALLPLLSKRELGLLRGLIEILVGPTDDRVGQVYTAISESMGGRGIPPLFAILKSKQAANFRAGASILYGFMEEVIRPSQRPMRNQSLYILVQCVLSDIRRQKKDLTVYWISMGMRGIWSIVERDFPGYLESGLLASALAGGDLDRCEKN